MEGQGVWYDSIGYTNIGYIGTILILIIISFYLVKMFNKKEAVTLKEKSINYDIMQYVDKLINDKLEFYAASRILPYLTSEQGKISHIKVDEIRELFYDDVVASISDTIKSDILHIYSPDGFNLYVIQKYMTYINTLQMGKGEKINMKKVIDEIYS
jgi:uncharacterized protein (UPF0333 family)